MVSCSIESKFTKFPYCTQEGIIFIVLISQLSKEEIYKEKGFHHIQLRK